MLNTEVLDYWRSEGEANATLAYLKIRLVLILARVRPEQIKHQTTFWHFQGSFELRVYNSETRSVFCQVWAESTMHTKDTLINESSDWKNVEECTELLPKQNRLPLFAFIVKSIHACYLAALMVPTQHKDLLRVRYFVCHKKTHGFDRVISPVNVVSEQQNPISLDRPYPV